MGQIRMGAAIEEPSISIIGRSGAGIVSVTRVNFDLTQPDQKLVCFFAAPPLYPLNLILCCVPQGRKVQANVSRELGS
jgi:hypothetical protein